MDDDMLGARFCRNCRKPISPSVKICPNCGRDQDAKEPLPAPAQPVMQPVRQAPIVPPWAHYPPPDAELIELARQYKSERSARILCFWLGLFCGGLAWIYAYIAGVKMQAIRVRVAAKGIDPEIWIRQIYGR